MTYEAIETSAQDGRPVELYTFARQYQRWRYTSADREVVHDGNAFEPVAIRRGNIEQGQELTRSALRLNVPRDLEVVQLYAISPPSDALTLTVQQYHEGDGNAVVLWLGRIAGVSGWTGTSAEISGEPIYSSIRRIGLRRLYQRQCPHVLYGAQCGVNNTAFRITFDAASVSGLAVSGEDLQLQPDGYYEGGYIEWQVETGIFDRRFITGHTGATITLSALPVGLLTGQEVNVYPGCDHTIATCNGKFANAANYGGMPYIPTKNPFGNDPVY